MRLGSMGVTTIRGSRLGSAAAGSMGSVTTDTAAMEIGAGGSEGANGQSCPVETELTTIGGSEYMSRLGPPSKGCWCLACCSGFALAVGWQVPGEPVESKCYGSSFSRENCHALTKWISCEKMKGVEAGEENVGQDVNAASAAVTMIVRAAVSRVLKSCAGFAATRSRCWMSYSRAVGQPWLRPMPKMI